MSEAIAFCSFDEFVEGEKVAQQRHELVGGRVYVMSGGSERHDLVTGLIYEALAPGARARGCRPFMSNRLVRTPSGNGYYPDMMVTCGQAPDRFWETSPTLVVEVLSRSTAIVDRREKAVAYAAIPTLRLLLIVDPDQPRIEVAEPVDGQIKTWGAFGPGQVVFTEFGDIVIDTLYDQVDRTATTR